MIRSVNISFRNALRDTALLGRGRRRTCRRDATLRDALKAKPRGLRAEEGSAERLELGYPFALKDDGGHDRGRVVWLPALRRRRVRVRGFIPRDIRRDPS